MIPENSICYQTSNEMLVHLTTPKSSIQTEHTLVLDISGSMGYPAKITDENNKKIDTDRSYLDLTLHCMKMYIHNIKENDLLTVIVFNNVAYTILQNEIINESSRRPLIERLMNLNVCGGTNLWDGIKSALDLIRVKENNNIKYITVFTDGVSNINPSSGIIKTLKDYLAESFINIPIHILGFGYNLDIDVLNEIVDITNGSFNFIPTAAEMITVMVHLIANFKMKYNTNTRLIIDFKNITTEQIKDVCKYITESYTIDNNSIIINTGQIYYKTLLFNILPEYNPTVTFIVNGLTEDISEISITNVETLSPVFKLKAFYIQNVTKMYNNSKTDRFKKNESLYNETLDLLDIDNDVAQALVKDLVGEIKLGLNNPDNFRIWGKFYGLSFLGALKRQECNNRCDYAVQKFCSPEFEIMRDLINKSCDEIEEHPPSLSTRTTSTRGRQTSSQPRRSVSMRSYETQGGCINPKCLVKTPNGFTPLYMIKKDDEVMNGANEISIVECVVKYKCVDNKIKLCKLGNLEITPTHPIYKDNKWIFPNTIEKETLVNCEYVINLVLNTRESINVNNYDCCTLGHGIQGEVIGHPFLGTELVIDNLKSFVNDYNDGVVEISNVERNPETNLICKYV